MILKDLSNELVSIGFPDMFDFQMDGEILDLENMKGSVADAEGDIVVEFNITKLDEEDDFLYTEVELTNYPNLGYIAEDFVLTKFKNKLYAEDLTNEDYEDIKTFGEKIDEDKEIYKVFDKYLVLEDNGVYTFDSLEEAIREEK
jgi:hypothetical protein